jgi:transcriptional antiterminator RfaH
MHSFYPAWFSARTKPKHEHIVAANLRKNLGLEVFSPRLRLEKFTKRGLVTVTEPLFPCYIFVRCVLEDKLNDIQRTSGLNRMVNFGGVIPAVADEIISELRNCFESEDVIQIETSLMPGDEVTVANGAFAGMSAFVLKSLPAKKRVQILLEVLGRPVAVEVEREAVTLKNNSLAELAPILAAGNHRGSLSA